MATATATTVSDVERFVRQTVAEILNEDQVAPSCGIDKDTFSLEERIEIDLGGDGLDLVSIIILLEREYDMPLAQDVGKNATARDLILAIENKLAA